MGQSTTTYYNIYNLAISNRKLLVYQMVTQRNMRFRQTQCDETTQMMTGSLQPDQVGIIIPDKT